jgi:hypothetical protein
VVDPSFLEFGETIEGSEEFHVVVGNDVARLLLDDDEASFEDLFGVLFDPCVAEALFVGGLEELAVDFFFRDDQAGGIDGDHGGLDPVLAAELFDDVPGNVGDGSGVRRVERDLAVAPGGAEHGRDEVRAGFVDVGEVQTEEDGVVVGAARGVTVFATGEEAEGADLLADPTVKGLEVRAAKRAAGREVVLVVGERDRPGRVEGRLRLVDAPDFPFYGAADAAVDAVTATDGDGVLLEVSQVGGGLEGGRAGGAADEPIFLAIPGEKVRTDALATHSRMPPRSTWPVELKRWVLAPDEKLDLDRDRERRRPFIASPFWDHLEEDHQVDLPVCGSPCTRVVFGRGSLRSQRLVFPFALAAGETTRRHGVVAAGPDFPASDSIMTGPEFWCQVHFRTWSQVE